MLRLFRNKKAQSTAEYAILIGLVVAAVVGMQTYVKRGIQGRYRDASDDSVRELNSTANLGYWNEINPGSTAELKEQFEPTELSAKSTSTTLAESYQASKMEAGGTVARSSKQTTKQAAEDYQKYEYGPLRNQNPP